MTTARVAMSIVVLLGACRASAHAQGRPPLDPGSPSTLGAGSGLWPDSTYGLDRADVPTPSPGLEGAVVAPSLGSPGGPGSSGRYLEGSSISSSPPSAQPHTLVPMLGHALDESTWYTREEYFHWNERFDHADLLNESGLLITLGYQKRVGIERFRGELFGGTMDYVGGAQFDDGTVEPLSSETGYLGWRGEYDLVFEPDACPNASLFVGIGSRFWFRDLKDGATDSGVPVTGYQETWWTIYPYLGLETRRKVAAEPGFYASGRIGLTPLTYEHATWGDAVLYPQCGMTGQLEAGLRGQHFFCAAISEMFTWRQSAVARGVLQPDSTLFTIGLKAGVNF